MAIYRTIPTTFWEDTKVADDFTPEDKYFMLYCLTNSHTNLCGCYEISLRQMSIDLGYNKEAIEKLLKRFSKNHKVIYYNFENKELFIKNWSKYNWTKSEKLDKPLLNEIKSIKSDEFKKILVKKYNDRDTVSIPYIYSMDTTCIDTTVLYCTDTDTVDNKNKSILKEEQEKLEEQAEFVWAEYPKKEGKTSAINSIIQFLQGKKTINKRKYKLSLEEILSATMKYADEMKNTDKQFICYGSTFYNGRILDYIDNV